MGKSLFKSLVSGVRSFKSPAKERPVKDDNVKKKNKDKCFGNLGKSSSRNREMVAAASASPEAIEIKCVQVESEKFKDVLPVPEPEPDPHFESKAPSKSQEGEIIGNGFIQMSPPGQKEHNAISVREEWAASKIQAAFRCYLAQRAFHALRALVRLQALARGRLVRRQAAASLRCMNALIRIQALARGRRVRNSELGQLVHKHLQQTKQARKKPAEGWVNSTATAQQWHAKVQVKQDAATRRQRALVYTFSEQLNRRSQKLTSSSGSDSPIDKSHWVWEWLERWTATTPKGGPASLSVEDCGPVTRNMEKAKVNTKVGKHLDSSRKERRKWGEHANSISPLSQRDLLSEECEEPSMEAKREEEMKTYQDSERFGTPKATVAGGYSTEMLAVQKPTSSPSTLGTLHVSPLKEGIDAVVAREFGLQEVSSPASDTLSLIQPSQSNGTTEAGMAEQSTVLLSEAFPSAAFGCNDVPRADTTSSSDDNSVMLYPLATSRVSALIGDLSTSNGHPVCAATVMMGSDSPLKELNSSSVFPFAPQEVGSMAESMTSFHPCSKLDMQDISISHTAESMISFHPCSEPNMQDISATHALYTPESAGDCVSNGLHQREEIMQDKDSAMHMFEEATIHSMSGDKGRQVTKETDYCISGDAARASDEAEGVVIEPLDSLDLKNDDYNQGDASSEANGGCDSSVVSVDARSTGVSSKNMSGSGSKHEQTESASPSLPSYMATTKSAKAKVRMLTSPKQKSDSTKQKQESPRPKLDSPKTKVDSPTQKVDSASKRRHSLSALDGKVSPGNPKPTFHVRAGSKGNFSSMKDLSTDNLSLSNGDSRRHGK